MRIALIPLQTRYRDPAANLRHLEERLDEAERHRPDLVVLPECTLTGYLYEEEDLARFAEPVPGPTTQEMARLARQHGFWLCFGLVERVGALFYNTALLLDRRGHIALRHRKVHEKPPYALGESVRSLPTELGHLSVLICGDLFDEAVARQIDPSTNLLLVPMNRSFDGASPDAARWEREERGVYIEAVRAIGLTTAIVNALEEGTEEPAFGGALLVAGDGRVLAESPHGTEEMVIYDWTGGCR